jgi:hypothetical protein
MCFVIRGAADLQRAAQLVAERRARWLQRAAAVEALRLETLEDLEAANSREEIDAVLKGLDWSRAQRLSAPTRLTPCATCQGRLRPSA